MEGGREFVGFLVLLPFFILGLWICIRIFRRAGRSGWWGLLFLVPIVNIGALWVFSFIHWPTVDGRRAKEVSKVFE